MLEYASIEKQSITSLVIWLSKQPLSVLINLVTVFVSLIFFSNERYSAICLIVFSFNFEIFAT